MSGTVDTPFVWLPTNVYSGFAQNINSTLIMEFCDQLIYLYVINNQATCRPLLNSRCTHSFTRVQPTSLANGLSVWCGNRYNKPDGSSLHVATGAYFKTSIETVLFCSLDYFRVLLQLVHMRTLLRFATSSKQVIKGNRDVEDHWYNERDSPTQKDNQNCVLIACDHVQNLTCNVSPTHWMGDLKWC